MDKKQQRLVDIDPNLKRKMKETLNSLAQYLLQRQPADPVKSTFKFDSVCRSPTLSNFWRACKARALHP